MSWISRLFSCIAGSTSSDVDNTDDGYSSGDEDDYITGTMLTSGGEQREVQISKAESSKLADEVGDLNLLCYTTLEKKVRRAVVCAFSHFDPYSMEVQEKTWSLDDLEDHLEDLENRMLKKLEVQGNRKTLFAFFYQLIVLKIPSVDTDAVGVRVAKKLPNFSKVFPAGELPFGPIGKRLGSMPAVRWAQLKESCEELGKVLLVGEVDTGTGKGRQVFVLTPDDVKTAREKFSEKLIDQLLKAVDAGLKVQQKQERKSVPTDGIIAL